MYIFSQNTQCLCFYVYVYIPQLFGILNTNHEIKKLQRILYISFDICIFFFYLKYEESIRDIPLLFILYNK